MSLLRQPILMLARSQGVKKLVSTMPVSSGIVTSYVPGEQTADAVRATRALVDDGLRVTLDYLADCRVRGEVLEPLNEAVRCDRHRVVGILCAIEDPQCPR